MRHIHLDPVGGVAGDMFLAAVLDAWPDLEGPMVAAVRAAGLPPRWSVDLLGAASAGITGKQVVIRDTDAADAHTHATGSFRDIRARLEAATRTDGAALTDEVCRRAVDIFHRLAVAEGKIHGTAPEDVHFHEIADWDSLADIVAAAFVIDALSPASWSVGDLPMGSGTVMSAHGILPVPAPATALLLEGYRLVDDGAPGERVTPTGAAILTHLGARQGGLRPAGILRQTGYGLGQREIKGMANLLRLLAFETGDGPGDAPDDSPMRRQIGVIDFEVDDMAPEDLAAGVDRLRETARVLDVTQTARLGKKGRVAISVCVLCHAEAVEEVTRACFLETSTIGLRWRLENRIELHRQSVEIGGMGAKSTARPDGMVTLKADMDMVAEAGSTQAERARIRRLVEGGEDA